MRTHTFAPAEKGMIELLKTLLKQTDQLLHQFLSHFKFN